MRSVRRSLALLAVIVVVAAVALPSLIPSLNPFGSESVDRSPPTVLRSLAKLNEYRAATANLQQIVDVEEDTVLPAFLAGERTLLQATGSVDAAVDFRGLRAGDNCTCHSPKRLYRTRYGVAQAQSITSPVVSEDCIRTAAVEQADEAPAAQRNYSRVVYRSSSRANFSSMGAQPSRSRPPGIEAHAHAHEDTVKL